MEGESDTEFFDVDGHMRRAEDRIPSAYKLWMQTALNHMQTPPQMISDIKKAIEEANEAIIHKINNNIQSKVGEVQIDLANYKLEQATEKLKEAKCDADLKERLKAIETRAKTLQNVITVIATLVAGSFTLVAIFAS